MLFIFAGITTCGLSFYLADALPPLVALVGMASPPLFFSLMRRFPDPDKMSPMFQGFMKGLLTVCAAGPVALPMLAAPELLPELPRLISVIAGAAASAVVVGVLYLLADLFTPPHTSR